jgi:hypothetical protein
MIGPKVAARGGRVVPYGHALFGFAYRQTTTENPAFFGRVNDSEGAFSMALGGGFDVKLNRRISIRALQVDYVRTAFDPSWGTSPHNARIATGVVFTFGGK